MQVLELLCISTVRHSNRTIMLRWPLKTATVDPDINYPNPKLIVQLECFGTSVCSIRVFNNVRSTLRTLQSYELPQVTRGFD